jgi:hypothetical protein
MMKEITMETKIADLLNNYPGMKETLIAINPKFKKLNNPVLRRTLAKVAGVRQAAIVGGMDPLDLLNRLREAVGQPPVDAEGVATESEAASEAPEWIDGEVKATLNANELLDAEKNPLAEAHMALKGLKEAEMIAIESDFKPEPLIEEFKKVGHEVYCKEESPERFLTYVRK